MGEFNAGNARGDPATEVKATLGKPLTIKCPSHTKGVGNSYLWGSMPPDGRPPALWQPGMFPIQNAFFDEEGSFVFQSLTKNDVDLINSLDLGGVSCMLYRKEILSSNPIKIDVSGQGE